MVNLRYYSEIQNEWFYFQATRFVKTRSANFHEYSWNPDVFQFDYGAQVKTFLKDPITYSATLDVRGSADQKRVWLEKFHFACDTDIVSKTPGKLYWGDMYIECYIISTSTEPNEGNVTANNEIGIYCPYPSWIYEWTYGFLPNTAAQVADRMGVSADRVTVKEVYVSARPFYTPFSALPSDFRMVLINDTGVDYTYFGPSCVTPNGETRCYFYDTLNDGEALIVDSRHGKKTAELCTVPASGEPVPYKNIYGSRLEYSKPFKRLDFTHGDLIDDGYPAIDGKRPFYFLVMQEPSTPPDKSLTEGLMCTIYYERSEPAWISS